MRHATFFIAFSALIGIVLFFGGVLSFAGAASVSSAVSIADVPFVPSGFGAGTVSATQINLSWTDNSSNEDGFSIERKTGSSGVYAQIATTTQNAVSYSDAGLTPNTTYVYQIRAFNANGYSPYSNEASAATLALSSPPAGGGGSGFVGSGGGTGYLNVSITPTTIRESVLRGIDLNGDALVGIVDMSILLYYYGKTGTSILRYDFNGSGEVDFPDVSVMMFYWTG